MKAIVDKDTCIGCGLCPSICPEVFDMDDDIVDDDESNCSEGCLCPECEARLKKYGNISAEDISDVEWLDFLVVGDHTLPRPIDISDLEDTDE